MYLQEAYDLPLLSFDEERELLKRSKAGDNEARDLLVAHNVRLIKMVVEKYKNKRVPWDDMFQEGVIGLLKAVDRFDLGKDNRFSTYATWWIIQSVTRFNYDMGRTVRVPCHSHEILFRIFRFIQDYMKEYGVRPKAKQVAEKVGISENEVMFLISQRNRVYSLNAPLKGRKNDASSLCLEEIIPVNMEESMVRGIDRKELRRVFFDILEGFSEKEKDIIVKRYGLDGKEPMSYREIGKVYGYTGEWVRREINRILTSIGAPNSKKYRKYLKSYWEAL
jgi:RNA polymerase primary sigma factor